MEIFIIILLSIVVFVCIILMINQKNIQHTADELREINGTETNLQVKLYIPNKQLEKLIIEINSLLEDKQRYNIIRIRKEKELREQIVNISHDLRTPLTSILGYIELLKDESYSQEEKMQCLDVIEKRSKVLQLLITNFYELSRLEANEYVLSLEVVNIHNVLCEIIATFYNSFMDKGFDLKVDLDEKVPTLITDKKVVFRIFNNLIQNAFIHGAKNIWISQKILHGNVVTSISNDTESLTEADLKHIFDRFFTGDKMRTSQSTGLGLTIVKKFVEEIGAKITANLDNHIFTIEIEWKN